MSIYTFNKYYKIYKNSLKNLYFNNISFDNFKFLCDGNVFRKGGGRNNKGHITSYQRGGGVKRFYKKISFDYNFHLKNNMMKIFGFFCNWYVERVEYDPNRTANILLLKSNFSFFRGYKLYTFLNNFLYKMFNNIYIYRIAPFNIKKGDIIGFFDKEFQFYPKKGQYCQLKDIWTGSFIFNIERIPNNGGTFVRSAGSKCKLLRKLDKYGLVILPSKEKRLFLLSSYITIGYPSNEDNHLKKLYKYGNNFYQGIRPHVRGVAMNPVDHPHGGGEGKTSGGRHSVSPWGQLTKGFVTSRRRWKKNKFIKSNRKKGR